MSVKKEQQENSNVHSIKHWIHLMEKYRLVEERKIVPDEVLPNEVRITQQGKPRNYISYSVNLFAKGADQIVLKAMGRACNKAVTIAEILKRKMPLYQITSLSSCELIDIFEPLEEGLDIVESKRYVSCMIIILSKFPLDTSNKGYQPPLPPEEIMQDSQVSTQRSTMLAVT